MFHLRVLPPLAATAFLAGCGGDGASTTDVKQAAIEQVRAKFGLGADVPLEAQAWTGREHDGKLTLCGTVSGGGEGSVVPPQRFLATIDPVEFLVIEGAHDEMRSPQPSKFTEWAPLCAGAQTV